MQRQRPTSASSGDVWQRTKWNGWGDANAKFFINDNGVVQNSRTGVELPKLLTFAKDIVRKEADEELDDTPSISPDEITLPTPVENAPFTTALASFLNKTQFSSEKMNRLCHCYGSSLRDLYRLRKGIISDAPDVVLYPHSHEDVERIVQAASAHNTCLIPSGGRTNIVGALEVERKDRNRLVACVDMRRMNRMLWVDKKSMTACFELGALGPEVESQLAREGLSLGHDPDSFEWSTLGGWLATCSSGMQSDKYGDIEDMCVSIKIVTPAGGTITTPPVPRNGSGPSLKHFFIGAEGTLGIMTQAVMRVHRKPSVVDFQAFLFPTWEDGVASIHQVVRKEVKPAMIRLYDPDETQLSFNMKPASSKFVSLVSSLIQGYLTKVKGYNTMNICLMIVGYEGENEAVKWQKKMTMPIFRSYSGFAVGSAPGKSWHEKRYDLPLLRDLLLDHGLWVDVAESSMSWSNLLPLWRDVKQSLNDFFEDQGLPCFVGAHISHTYETGACVYFHFATTLDSNAQEDLELYTKAKKAATQAILRNGGALSHHHGVGFEHIPFMGHYMDWGSLQILRAMKHSLDPKDICNPGKLLPAQGTENMDDPTHSFYTRGIADKVPAKI
eukprot:TRINITY_DN2079_c0_g1_i1.p1 TRINITY_DN2079_c0_g1~~TRINITY_DN2079_c0_g1_i1.p1  ORF type:complete len:612 (-),score=68.00 TRINITY_DN2079_c0_g1_i1:25-1860(-)